MSKNIDENMGPTLTEIRELLSNRTRSAEPYPWKVQDPGVNMLIRRMEMVDTRGGKNVRKFGLAGQKALPHNSKLNSGKPIAPRLAQDVKQYRPFGQQATFELGTRADGTPFRKVAVKPRKMVKVISGREYVLVGVSDPALPYDRQVIASQNVANIARGTRMRARVVKWKDNTGVYVERFPDPRAMMWPSPSLTGIPGTGWLAHPTFEGGPIAMPAVYHARRRKSGDRRGDKFRDKRRKATQRKRKGVSKPPRTKKQSKAEKREERIRKKAIAEGGRKFQYTEEMRDAVNEGILTEKETEALFNQSQGVEPFDLITGAIDPEDVLIGSMIGEDGFFIGTPDEAVQSTEMAQLMQAMIEQGNPQMANVGVNRYLTVKAIMESNNDLRRIIRGEGFLTDTEGRTLEWIPSDTMSIIPIEQRDVSLATMTSEDWENNGELISSVLFNSGLHPKIIEDVVSSSLVSSQLRMNESLSPFSLMGRLPAQDRFGMVSDMAEDLNVIQASSTGQEPLRMGIQKIENYNDVTDVGILGLTRDPEMLEKWEKEKQRLIRDGFAKSAPGTRWGIVALQALDGVYEVGDPITPLMWFENSLAYLDGTVVSEAPDSLKRAAAYDQMQYMTEGTATITKSDSVESDRWPKEMQMYNLDRKDGKMIAADTYRENRDGTVDRFTVQFPHRMNPLPELRRVQEMRNKVRSHMASLPLNELMLIGPDDLSAEVALLERRSRAGQTPINQILRRTNKGVIGLYRMKPNDPVQTEFFRAQIAQLPRGGVWNMPALGIAIRENNGGYVVESFKFDADKPQQWDFIGQQGSTIPLSDRRELAREFNSRINKEKLHFEQQLRLAGFDFSSENTESELLRPESLVEAQSDRDRLRRLGL